MARDIFWSVLGARVVVGPRTAGERNCVARAPESREMEG
jgi:hypothetical protein